VISRKIHKSFFIATPIGMQELYMHAQKSKALRPLFIEQLLFLNDWVSYFRDNKMLKCGIKYYQVPHR
jgi:hypothetical protein